MSEKRTIESFLKELQPEHAEKALRNYLSYESWRRSMDFSEDAVNHVQALSHAFWWRDTEEGQIYWDRIAENIDDGVYVFPPQPVKDAKEFIAPTGEAGESEQNDLIAEFMSVFGLSFKSKKWTDEIEIIKSKFILQRK